MTAQRIVIKVGSSTLTGDSGEAFLAWMPWIVLTVFVFIWGQPVVKTWLNGIFAPAGALRSTVENLLSFLSAVLPNSRSPLEAPAQLLVSIRRPAPAAGGEQALGWDVVTGTDPLSPRMA